MRVRIGDFWYDSEKQPLCVELDEMEQQELSKSINTNTNTKIKYITLPKKMEHDDNFKSHWLNQMID